MTVRLSTMPVLGDGNRSSAGNGRKLHIVVAVEGEKTLLSRCGKRSQPSPRSLSYLLEMMEEEEPITVEKLIVATGIRNPRKFCAVCVKLSPIPMGGRRKKTVTMRSQVLESLMLPMHLLQAG